MHINDQYHGCITFPVYDNLCYSCSTGNHGFMDILSDDGQLIMQPTLRPHDNAGYLYTHSNTSFIIFFETTTLKTELGILILSNWEQKG